MAHPHDHKHHSHLHKHHSHHHDRGYPHEKYHMYGRRGPTRFLWFAIGVGSAVWWFRCPRERENNPSRGGSFPHWDRTGASTHRPGTVPMNWNDYQERAGAQMRETMNDTSEAVLDTIMARAMQMKQRLVERRAALQPPAGTGDAPSQPSERFPSGS